ncbi:MAG: hypothetical protein WC736_14685 [Gallionella sp.]|jgi:hypothetical protein
MNNNDMPTIPVPPPIMPQEGAHTPTTLVVALTTKLNFAKDQLGVAEALVASLEAEIANVPDWARDMTADELQGTVERWFE